MRHVFIVILAAFSLALKPDKPVQHTDVESYTGHKIIIGTEGGIVAMRNETIILHTGEIFYHNNVAKEEYRYLKTLNKKDLRQVFCLGESLSLPWGGFSHPGNMSTFLQVYHNKKLIRNFVWGEPGTDVPASLDKAYSGIINIIK